MEEQKKEMDGRMAETSEDTQNVPETGGQDGEDAVEEPQREPGFRGFVNNLPTRTYTLWVLAGVYFVYTGYQLCKGKLEGLSDSSWGFFAAGVGFWLIAVFFLFFGVRGLMKRDKEKKAEQAAATEAARLEAAASGDSDSREDAGEKKKPMSIAERAKLASNLDDEPEEETQEQAKGTEKED